MSTAAQCLGAAEPEVETVEIYSTRARRRVHLYIYKRNSYASSALWTCIHVHLSYTLYSSHNTSQSRIGGHGLGRGPNCKDGFGVLAPDTSSQTRSLVRAVDCGHVSSTSVLDTSLQFTYSVPNGQSCRVDRPSSSHGSRNVIP